MTNVIFDYVPSSDLPTALEIEQLGYPPDEAGTEASFRLRQSQAGNLFLGAYESNEGSRTLIGYICSTLSPATSLTHESMSTHVTGSNSVCIHSVCVAPSHRRKRVGLALLKEYVRRLEQAQSEGLEGLGFLECILLITHDDLRGFYEKAGFEWLGRSSVVHGSKPWFEMRFNLSASKERETQSLDGGQQILPGVLEALQRRPDVIPSSRLISDYPNGLSDLLQPDTTTEGVSVNKFDLLCPRDGCGSIILKKGVGKWVERASVQLEPLGLPPNPDLIALPTPPQTAQWWLITPSPMEFENIGFTRPIQPLVESGRRMKLLVCAECDLGPLGWCEEGGSEFWLACSRVRYGA